MLFLLGGTLAGCGWLHSNCFYSAQPSMQSFVETSVGPIFVRKIGAGRPVVFVHGNLGSHADFTLSPSSSLVSEKYAVYALDRYGAGYSRRRPMRALSLEEHADILAEVIQGLGLTSPIVMGHSYGGAVSLMFALRHPDLASGLLLIAPAAHDWQGDGVSEYRLLTTPLVGPIIMQTAFVPLAKWGLRSAMESVFAPAPVPEEYLEHLRRVATVPQHFIASALDMQRLRPGLRTISERYSEVSLPVVVLVGDRDAITPYWNHGQRLKDNLPNGTVQLLQGAGHQIHFSHPEKILAALSLL